MKRKIGDVIEFYIIPGLWRIGIIEKFSIGTPRYGIRFVRTIEDGHCYHYCVEDEVRDVQL